MNTIPRVWLLRQYGLGMAVYLSLLIFCGCSAERFPDALHRPQKFFDQHYSYDEQRGESFIGAATIRVYRRSDDVVVVAFQDGSSATVMYAKSTDAREGRQQHLNADERRAIMAAYSPEDDWVSIASAHLDCQVFVLLDRRIAAVIRKDGTLIVGTFAGLMREVVYSVYVETLEHDEAVRLEQLLLELLARMTQADQLKFQKLFWTKSSGANGGTDLSHLAAKYLSEPKYQEFGRLLKKAARKGERTKSDNLPTRQRQNTSLSLLSVDVLS